MMDDSSPCERSGAAGKAISISFVRPSARCAPHGGRLREKNVARPVNELSEPNMVSVQPSVGRWQVIMEGRAKRAEFSDRERAVSYAQIWAAVNRPSRVVVYSAAGAIQEEWKFAAPRDRAV